MNIKENISLQPYNTFGIEAKAKQFSSFSSVEELQELLVSVPPLSAKLILGGGSNILFTKDFDGLILKNELKGIELIKEDEEYYYIKAFAGEIWHELVKHCISHNYSGIENLSLIPGNVGAAPMQNIGAYGVELKDVFHELEAFHIHEKVVQRFSAADCEFGYRDSIFKKRHKGQFVILNITIRLPKKPVFNTSYASLAQELEKMHVKDLSAATISKAVIQIRESKLPDPKKTGNAGSFFKNPEVSKFRWHVIWEERRDIVAHKTGDATYKIAAGWLIEQCGWKGYRKNDAGCYEKQALVLVNYGHASGQEIFELSEEIIQSVQKKFGIVLEREVNII